MMGEAVQLGVAEVVVVADVAMPWAWVVTQRRAVEAKR